MPQTINKNIFTPINWLIILLAALSSLAAQCGASQATEQPAAVTEAAPAEAEATAAPQVEAEAETTTAPQAETEAGDAPQSDEVIQVRMMSSLPEGAAEQPLLVELTKEYEAEHRNVKINWEWAGFDLYDQKLRAYIQAGDPPDAFTDAVEVHVQRAREGLTLPLDEYLAQPNYENDSTWLDTFYPSLMEQDYLEDAKEGPGYYVIPVAMNTSGIYYNVNLFAEHGLTPPKTFAELLEICKKLEAAGVTPFMMDGGFTPYTTRPFVYTAIRIGGEQAFYDTALHKEGTSWVDNPDWLKTAEETQKLFNYHQEGFLGYQWPTAQIEFSQGGGGMMIMASWLPAELVAEAPEGFEMSLFRFPAYEEGKGDQTTSEVNFDGFGIPKEAKHPQEAMDFLKFLTSRAVQERWAEQYLKMSPVQGTKMPASIAAAQELVSTSKLVPMGAGVDVDAVEWRSTILEPLLAELSAGMSPADFITELQQQSDEFYAKK